MRITFVRHGQTTANVLGRLDTAPPGAELTAIGRSQAEALPTELTDTAIEAIAVSPLRRTGQTAAPLAVVRGLDAVVVPGFQEVDAGSLELRDDDEAHLLYLETSFGWARGDLDRAIPGGEDGHAFFARYDHAVAAVEATGAASAVVVSHGAAIRVWVAGRAGGLDVDFAADHPLPNTARVVVEGSLATGWTLVDWIARPAGGIGPLQTGVADPTGAPLDELAEDARVDGAADDDAAGERP